MTRPQCTFRDEARVLRAITLAGIYGLEGASKRTGIAPSLISTWRTNMERLNGWRFKRPARKPRGNGKLSLAKAREMRAKRARGLSWGVLARIYKVCPATCQKVCAYKLYPEPAWQRRPSTAAAARREEDATP